MTNSSLGDWIGEHITSPRLRPAAREDGAALISSQPLRAVQVVAPRPIIAAMLDLGGALVATAERLAPRRRALRVRDTLSRSEQLRAIADPFEAVEPLQFVVDVGVQERARVTLDHELGDAKVQQRQAAVPPERLEQ